MRYELGCIVEVITEICKHGVSQAEMWMFMSSNDMAKEQKSLCCRAQDACLYGRSAWTISLQFLLVEQLALVYELSCSRLL